MDGRHGGRGAGRRHRGRRGQWHLRPPGVHARLHRPGPRPLPRHRRDRGVPGPAAGGPNRACPVRLGRPGQGPVVPGRLRLLRADPHHRPQPRGGVRDPGPRDARQGARDPGGADVPAVGGQVRQLPVRRGARRPAGPRRRPGVVDGRRGGRRHDRGRPRRDARDADLGPGRRRTRLVQARLDRGRPGAKGPGQRQQHARRDLGGPRRDDHGPRRRRGPLLPGGVSRGGVAAPVHPGREPALGRLR